MACHPSKRNQSEMWPKILWFGKRNSFSLNLAPLGRGDWDLILRWKRCIYARILAKTGEMAKKPNPKETASLFRLKKANILQLTNPVGPKKSILASLGKTLANQCFPKGVPPLLWDKTPWDINPEWKGSWFVYPLVPGSSIQVDGFLYGRLKTRDGSKKENID